MTAPPPPGAMAISKRKEHPVSFRLPDDVLAAIDRAVAVRGSSRTEFVREALMRAAELELLERRVINMTPAAFRHLLAEIDKPARTIPELAAVARRTPPWESGR